MNPVQRRGQRPPAAPSISEPEAAAPPPTSYRNAGIPVSSCPIANV